MSTAKELGYELVATASRIRVVGIQGEKVTVELFSCPHCSALVHHDQYSSGLRQHLAWHEGQGGAA